MWYGAQGIRGLVEDGQIRLREQVTLPEQTTVYVVIPEPLPARRGHIYSPRLTHREDAGAFIKQVLPSADALFLEYDRQEAADGRSETIGKDSRT